MNIEWIGPAPDTNYHVGRDGNQINFIVQHWMAGTFEAALARFQNPASVVSAHYLVGQTRGRIAQLVKDEDTAFHAGEWQANLRSIGIEAETSPSLAPTDDLYANLADLYRYLSQKYGFQLVDGVTVRPHHQIVPTQCPGIISIPRIIQEAETVATQFVTETEFSEYKSNLEAELASKEAETIAKAVAAALKAVSDKLAA